MRIKEIEITVGRTVNLGNFNSARVEFSATAELDSDEDPTQAQRDLYSDLRRKVEAAAESLRHGDAKRQAPESNQED